MVPPVRHKALEAAFEATGQFVVWRDPEADALALDGAVLAVTGYPPERFRRLDDLLDIVHEEDRPLLARRCAPSEERAGVHLVRFRVVRPDGGAVPCEGSVARLSDEASDDVERLPGGASGDVTTPSDRASDGARSEYVLVVRALPVPSVREESNRLAELIEYLPDYVSIHSTDGRCLSMNAAGRRMLGIGRDEDVRRLGFVDIVADSTSAPPHLLLPVVMSHGSHSTDVVMTHRRNATRVPAAWSASVVNDASPIGRYVVCIARDVSEQLEIEWELRQNQRRLTHALDVSRLGEWSMDIRTQSGSQSRRVTEIFGHGAEVSETWNYQVFLGHIHVDDRERVERAFSRALESGGDLDFEARIVRRDGELRWISARAGINRGLGGDGQHIGGVIQDITTRKFAEQRDRFFADVSVPLNTLVDDPGTLEQVARLALPFIADHCSVDLVASDGGFERVTATHSLLAAEAVGSADVSDGAPGPLPSLIGRMLEQRQPMTLDISSPEQLDRIARTRSERLSLRALDVGSYLGVPLTLRGRRLGLLSFYRAGSDTRYTAKDRQIGQELGTRVATALENVRLYRALQDTDHRKDEFLAMLSHELRNPLESLSVGVSLLESAADESQGEWARTMMREQITRLSSILEDLLDVSRYTFNKVVLRREPTALAPLLEQSVEEMRGRAEALGYRVVLDVADAPVHANVDAPRLAQVVSNLLTNAVKYGEQRGTIRVELVEREGEAVLTVSDDGVGISAEALGGVFELFAQVDTTIDRSLGGLGMGLTLVRRIVEMHDGRVAAHSEGPDRGTRFVIRLPIVAAPASDEHESVAYREPIPLPPVPSREEGPRPVVAGGGGGPASNGGSETEAASGKRRLMLVDDNVETVSALQKLFSMKGYDVRTAHDGLDALSLAEEFDPHAAVLDIGLPGASGYEVANALRERYGARPLLLVALSGYGQEEDRLRAREAGFDHHLLKPANFRTIAELLSPD